MIHSGVHDSTLVLLSIAIAVIASYTALDLAARMRLASENARRFWLAGAATAMGGGIWSMHFVAMLAFSVPGMEVVYDLPLTLASLAIAVLFTAFGFACAFLPGARPVVIAASGSIMGLGIAAMHYTGMAAMRMHAELGYDTFWVGASLLIAIGASTVALWLSFRRAAVAVRAAAAVLMGLAVSGMHYAAMQGATFTTMGPMSREGYASVGQTNLALWVATTTAVILLMALGAATLDKGYTERLEKEAAALRESEERFRLLVQSVTDYAIVMVDPNGAVTNWNVGAERIYGYEAGEILGRHCSVFRIAEDQASGVQQRVLSSAAANGKCEEEGWRVRKDGSRFFGAVLTNPIRNDGRTVGFAMITRDLTEWRQAQANLEATREALFQAQKMESLGQLTGGVAHDFNNLLAAVLGSLELLRKRIPDDPRSMKLLDNAVQGARRGASLTQRMLSFSRRQNLQPRAVDLRQLVAGMADLLSRSVGPQHRIETRFPNRLRSASVDPHQLELALMNLVVNARDAMPDGGTIIVAGSDADDGAADMVVLSVRDEGAGMDEATLARAQEPFFTTKGVGKGTGLGLSMVRGLAEQSRGRLVVKSMPGEGTTAEIWLPAATADAAAPVQEPGPQAAVARAPLRIMVVDDDPLVLENTAAMLEDLGHQVVEASSAEEALAILEHAGKLDVLLTDQAMPGLTGSELAERVVGKHPGTAVVLATGYLDFPGSVRHPCLQKPFTQAELEAALSGVGSTDQPVHRERSGEAP